MPVISSRPASLRRLLTVIVSSLRSHAQQVRRLLRGSPRGVGVVLAFVPEGEPAHAPAGVERVEQSVRTPGVVVTRQRRAVARNRPVPGSLLHARRAVHRHGVALVQPRQRRGVADLPERLQLAMAVRLAQSVQALAVVVEQVRAGRPLGEVAMAPARSISGVALHHRPVSWSGRMP